MTWRGDTTISDRIFASLPYLLILADGVRFSHSFMNVMPMMGVILAPVVLPILAIEQSIPFANLLIFLGLYFWVVQNDRVHHFIRFNVMQALLLSIILFLVDIFLGLFQGIELLSFSFSTLQTTVFLSVLAIFVYSLSQTSRGKYTELPWISEAVNIQIP